MLCDKNEKIRWHISVTRRYFDFVTDRKCRCVVSPYLFTHSGGDTLRSVAIVVDNFDNCLLSVFWKRLDGGVSPFKSLLNAIEKRKLVRCVRISWPSPILGCTTFVVRGKYNCTLVTACYSSDSYILNSHSWYLYLCLQIYVYVYIHRKLLWFMTPW